MNFIINETGEHAQLELCLVAPGNPHTHIILLERVLSKIPGIQLVNYSQQLYSISQELYQKANAFLTMYQYYQKQLGKLANLKDPVCLQFAIATCKTPAPMFSLQDFYYPDKDVIDTYIKLLETYLWRM